MRKLHLQPAFPGQRALAENFQDQPGAIEHLAVPGLLQVALLDRAHGMIDDDEAGLVLGTSAGDLLDLAGAQQRCRPRPHERDDLGQSHVEGDGLGQPDRLLQAILGGALGVARGAVRRCRLAGVDGRRAGRTGSSTIARVGARLRRPAAAAWLVRLCSA